MAMKIPHWFALPLILLAAAPAGLAAPKAAENPKAVLPVARRLEALKTAAQILADRTPTWAQRAAELPDPFFRRHGTSEAGGAGAARGQDGRPSELSDLEILRTIAPGIQPTGTMLIGDEPYLLIGDRRLKVGDQITVTFDGGVYRIVLSSIERNAYVLRLNEQELAREFK